MRTGRVIGLGSQRWMRVGPLIVVGAVRGLKKRGGQEENARVEADAAGEVAARVLEVLDGSPVDVLDVHVGGVVACARGRVRRERGKM